MGIGLRVFLIDDDDSLQRLLVARYDRLFRRDRGERLPQYAGKRIRCALVVLDIVGRKPLAIRAIDCSILPFDADGYLDLYELDRGSHLAVESISPVIESMLPEQVIDAGHHFAKKRFHREFKWDLASETQEAIFRSIFK